ncbi:MAG: hypothetical protein Q9170_005729 [Blastenia crenularia]
MATSNQADDIAADAQSSEATTGANHPTSVPEVADHNTVNDFDNPNYQVSGSHAGEHDSIPADHARSESLVESKEEEIAPLGMDSAGLASAPVSRYATQGAHESRAHYPLQRGFTDPTLQSSVAWNNYQIHGVQASNGAYDQAGGMQQGLHRNPPKVVNTTNGSYSRPRAQTNIYPPSQFAQQYQTQGGSNWLPITSQDRGWDDQNPSMYMPPTRFTRGSQHQPAYPVGHNNLGYVTSNSSDQYAAQMSSHASNTYGKMLNVNLIPGSMNNSQFTSSYNAHAANSYSHPPQHNGYVNIPKTKILKSQSPINANGTGGATMSNKRKSRSTVVKEMDSEDEDEEPIDVPETGDPEVNYESIEKAREAERPKFRTNPHKDETIPLTDRDKQFMVARMVRCMRSTKEAEDNMGMIKQWTKLKQDGQRVEQAAWRIMVGYLGNKG